MADATSMDIPPGHVNSQTASCTHPKQNMLEQGNEIEPSEQIHLSAPQMIENLQQESSTAVASLFSEQLQPFSDSVAKDSLRQASEQHSCLQVTTLEKAGEHESVNKCGGELLEECQPGSECVRNEPLKTVAALGTCPTNKHSESSPGNLTNDSLSKKLKLPQEDATMNTTGNTSCPKEVASEVKNEHGAGNLCTETAATKPNVDSNLLQNETKKIDSTVSSFVLTEKSSCPQQSTLGQIKDFGCGRLLDEAPKQEDHLDSGLVQNVPVETSIAASDSIVSDYLELPLGDKSERHTGKQVQQLPEDMSKSPSPEQFETSSKSLANKSSQLGRRDKQKSKSRKKKYKLRSLLRSDRVLRARTQEKPKSLESSSSLSNVGNGVEKKRMKEKKMRRKTRVISDEYSRIRTRLRYFLNRIHYEQNLIDAYSSEGWKGHSLEKLKPEKELERAKSEIFRRKLKIRDLFQQLDSLCAEGRFPKSLFDSEGQIDSEDIFCAKCGSKDMSANNDIILCDGACDRGFHQLCLEPPLLSEDIPPDDEGWLCPGCDCKVDCFDLLNDSLGTKLSVTDSWERVFPEAAAAAKEGKDQDLNLGFPSDDSDDDDYNPDGPEIAEKVEGDESSSDESEYTSACEELEAKAPSKDELNFGLSSDDSEDNNYDPDAPDDDENGKQEGLSSDFTSDSEDLAFTLNDSQFSEKDEINGPFGKSDKQSSKGGGNKSSVKDELLDALVLETGQDGSPPVSGKRLVERLDYKRLHDEAYGNAPSDSSDDEDWTDHAAPRKRKRTAGKALVSPNGNSSIIKNETTMDAANNDLEDNKHVPRRRKRQNSIATDENNSPNKSTEGSPKSGSAGRRLKSSSYRRLSEAATQRLYKSFKENQYPDRATKESLAEELGITPHKVSKWFENARWSYRHSSHKEPGISKSVSKESLVSPQTNEKLVESEQNTNITISTCNGSLNEELHRTGNAIPDSCSGDVGGGRAEMLTKESSCQPSTTPSTTPSTNPASKKRRGRPSKVERPETSSVVDSHETGSRKRGSRQKSAS